jgi:glycosyltransferase involved in cell wall biosynthesis
MADLLLVSDDIVGEKMAGPGIRAWEMARSLSRRFAVRLAVPDLSGGPRQERFFRGAPFETAFYALGDSGLIRRLAEESRIVLFQGYVLSKFPVLKGLGRYLVADIYDPFVLENLFVHQRKIRGLGDREAVHLRDLRVFNDVLLAADHFVCASDRQKDLYAGALMSLGRIGPAAFDADPTFAELLSVVPFGIAEGEGTRSAGPPADDPVGREFPGIGKDDILLLWGGVLSNWFDPATLLRGFSGALKRDPRLRLLFLSTAHPNPLLPPFETAADARRLAAELGLLDTAVFFRDGWVAYEERAAYFGRADVGVSIHRTHFETRYAFRTRILDYVKFGLPILCTEGDYFAELVGREDLGEVVLSESAADVEGAILRLAANPIRRSDIKGRLGGVRGRFAWDRIVDPLARHCERVLAGEVLPAARPGRKEIAFVCGGVTDSALRRGSRKILGGKILPGALARLRRWLRL